MRTGKSTKTARNARTRSPLRRGMTRRQVAAVLGPEDDEWRTRNGWWVVYSVLQQSGMVECDVHFRRGRATRWWGEVQAVIAARAEG